MSHLTVILCDGSFELSTESKIYQVAPYLHDICKNLTAVLPPQFSSTTFQNFLYLNTIGIYVPLEVLKKQHLIDIIKLCNYLKTSESDFDAMMNKACLVDFIECLLTTIPVLFYMYKNGYVTSAVKYANHIYLDPSIYNKKNYCEFRRSVRNYYRLCMFQRVYFSWKCLCGTCRHLNKIQQGSFFSGNEGTPQYKVWPRTHDISANPTKYPVPWEEAHSYPLPPMRHCWLKHRCRKFTDHSQ